MPGVPWRWDGGHSVPGKLLLLVLFLLFLPFFINAMEVSCFSPCILVLAREGNTLEALVQLSAGASSQFLLYA